MDKVIEVLNYLNGPGGAVLFAALFGVSEVLAQIPGVKANSVFQMIQNSIKWAAIRVQPKSVEKIEELKQSEPVKEPIEKKPEDAGQK